MKNAIRNLALAGLTSIALAGCGKPKEYILERPKIDNGSHILVVEGSVDGKQTNFSKVYNWDFSKVSESTWRNYPSAGRTEPYAEVKEDWTGTHVTLHMPNKDNSLRQLHW